MATMHGDHHVLQVSADFPFSTPECCHCYITQNSTWLSLSICVG